jgi:hypothetical protein
MSRKIETIKVVKGTHSVRKTATKASPAKKAPAKRATKKAAPRK